MEKLYSQQKQDQELTVAQIMNSLLRRLLSAVAPLGVQQGLWDTGFRSCVLKCSCEGTQKLATLID